jgi:outer membrane protein assembly factor BamB
MSFLRALPITCASTIALLATAAAGDWPTYRHDARRSATGPDPLPAALVLRWQHSLPTYEVAFPNEERQQFDLSHEPVCAAGVTVVGCPADGSVRAFAVRTGKELWRYYTEGPVRLAPVLHKGLVLFGSDDGRFHCLNLQTGKPVWDYQAFPAERPDARLLGNNRLISFWPVRGGAVVVGDTVYFGSGVWPTMGVYVQALDIRSGKPRWRNDRLGYLAGVRIDHNMRYDAGISPQGYLLATGDRLVVPNGRSHPVALNLTDGSLYHFVQGYRNGHCRVALGGDYVFVGHHGVLSQADFREVGSKWQAAGKDAPEAFNAGKFDLYEGPYHPYKKFPGCDVDSVFDGDTAYSLVDGVLYAHDLGDSGVSEYGVNQAGKELHPFRWDARMTLRAATGLGGNTRLFAKAGSIVYGRAGNRIVALELTGKYPAVRLAWEAKTEALPTSLVPAEEHLFAALADGSLLAFGAEDEAPAPALAKEPAAVSPAASPDLRALLAAQPATAGIALVLGSLSAAETESLLTGSKLRLIVATEDGAEVESERRRLAANGVYGTRVERFAGPPLDRRFPTYLGSLVWLRGKDLGLPEAAQLARLWRNVHPYGGALCFTGTSSQCSQFAQLAKATPLPGANIHTSDSWVRIDRPDGPAGAADWTHETADPARTYFSHDRAVQAPLAPLWYGDGPTYGFIKTKDYGRGVKPQVVEGRVFALQQRSRTLFAYDAYTGRLLWSTQGEGEDRGFITRFASLPDGIYAAGRGRCLVYDPATGEELRRMTFAGATGADKPARATAVVVSDQSVLIAASAIDTGAIEKGLWDADVLVCFDRQTGQIRWQRNARDRFNSKALAIGNSLVFCTDSLSPVAAGESQRRGEDITECTSTVLALDERTGAERWQHPYRAQYRKYGASSWLSVRGHDDWLAYAASGNQVLAGRARTTMLLDASSGQVVWDKPIGLAQPVVIMGDQLLDQGGRIVALATGDPVRSNVFRRGGCNYAVANPSLVFVRDQTVCYVDLASGERYRLRNMRSGCSNSLVAACGVLSIPNFAQGCVCNYPVQTSSAWIHRPEVADWVPADPVKLQPLRVDTGIATLDPAKVKEMHAFKRRFLVDDPKLAPEHLLARWSFDAMERNQVPDLSDHGNACQLTNPAFEPFGTGQALLGDGATTSTKGHAELKPAGAIQDAVTLAAWVKLGAKQHKGSAGVVERPQYYRLMVEQTEPPYSISMSVQTRTGWRSARTPRTISPGQWVHIAGTYDAEAGETAIYLNGKRVGTSAGQPGRIPAVSAAIDVAVRDGGAYLTGALDEVRIYDRALGPKAIAPLAKQP